jgi:hypothetical protein
LNVTTANLAAKSSLITPKNLTGTACAPAGNATPRRLGIALESKPTSAPLVVFSVLTGNADDHLRNHGFLREGRARTLSPA